MSAAATCQTNQAVGIPLTRHTAQVVDLGDEKLLVLNVSENDHSPEDISTVPTRSRLWAIVDRSGSMQGAFNRAMRTIGDMAESLRVPYVKIFTFDSVSETYDMTPNQLKSCTLTSRGSTNMKRTIEDLVAALNSIDGESIQLLVISDGDVFDKNSVLQYTRGMEHRIHTNNYIQVVGVRLFTSGYGNPDTQAITSIFTLNNHPHAASELYEMQIQNHRGRVAGGYHISQFDPVLAHLLETSTVETHIFAAPDGCLVRRYPWDEPSTEARLVPGMNCVILTGDINTFTTVEIDDDHVQVTEAQLESEQDLADFLRAIESNIRNWKVLGTHEMHVSAAIGFVKKLQSYFETRYNDPVLSCTLRSRIKVLRRVALAREKSITQAILQLENKIGVDRLNSQQQADFLRQLNKDHRSARSIAKRSRFSDVSELENALSEGLVNLCEGATRLPESTDVDVLPTSFYSVCDNNDAMEMIVEARTEISSMTTEEMLQCVGINGLAVDVHIGNYADPWQIRVNEVYDGCYLGQNDLWCAHVQAGPSVTGDSGIPMAASSLCPPGRSGKAITGVDPIRQSDAPEAFDLYMRNGVFNQIHSSITMRRVIAPLPDDALALKTATIYRQIQQIFGPTRSSSAELGNGLVDGGSDCNPSELKVKELIQNIETLRHQAQFTRTFDNLKAHIHSENFAAYFTGDMDVSHVLKVIAFLLSYDRVVELDLPKIFRAMFSLGMYHQLRKDTHKDLTERQTLRDDILGIDLDTHRTTAQEPFTEEPTDVTVYDTYDLEDMTTKTRWYRKFFHELVNVLKVLSVIRDVDISDRDDVAAAIIELSQVPSTEFIQVDCDCKLYTAAHTVQALQCTEMKHRVDVADRQVLLPELLTEADCVAVISDAVRAVYQEDYDRQLSRKKKEEKRILTEQRVADALNTDSMETFTNIMTTWIPRANYPGFMEIHDSLLDTNLTVPLRRAKIWFICIGRDKDGDEVWNNGNVAPDLFSFRTIFKNSADDGILEWNDLTWNKLMEIRKQFCKHTYRLGMSNRFGHSNSCPSWWALGYPNVQAYKKAVGNEYFMAYIYARRANRGILTQEVRDAIDGKTMRGATWSPQDLLD